MIGVIADDLTGAAELGGIGLRYGLKAEVLIAGKCDGKMDLLCVDTDSRSCTGNEAARRATAAARKLRKAGAAWIYKKVDSVLRGNVLAEVSAIQEALGLRSTLLAPANPRFGRVIRGGKYFVKGKPIHQTDFARDPEYPRRSPDVLKMLGVTKARRASVSRLGEYRPTAGIVLCEASSSVDVRKWASQQNVDTLVAGGAEFFEAVLKAIGPIQKKRAFGNTHSADLSSGRELFICGSTSDYTQKFISEARRSHTPVFSIIEGSRSDSSLTTMMLEAVAERAILAFQSHSRVVLAIGRPLIDGASVATRLAAYLVKIAVHVIERAGTERIYAEGGATAAELVRRLGWRRLKVLKELAPGVTTLAMANRNAPLLTIKPGSYPGWP
jgi:uncharacterized protein YgbK (DUF1537 family)